MSWLVTDEQLDELRLKGDRIRVVRDINPENDVIGLVVAWNEQELLIRKPNKKVVKLKRTYPIQMLSQERTTDHLNVFDHPMLENVEKDGAKKNDE